MGSSRGIYPTLHWCPDLITLNGGGQGPRGAITPNGAKTEATGAAGEEYIESEIISSDLNESQKVIFTVSAKNADFRGSTEDWHPCSLRDRPYSMLYAQQVKPGQVFVITFI